MSLIAHYKLDGNALDSSGYGNHGIVNGSNFSWLTGKINNSIKFTLGATRISTDLKTLDESGSPFSVSFWVYHDFTDWNRSIAYFGERSSINWMFYRNNTMGANLMGFLTYFTDTSDTATSNILYATIPHQQWVHIVLQLNAGNKKIYLNGTLVSEVNQPSWKKYNTESVKFGIGSQSAVSNSWAITDTYIDDVRIYNHALSIKEIKELAKAPVMQYTFDDFQEPTTNYLSDGIGGANVFIASDWLGATLLNVGQSILKTPIFQYSTSGTSYVYTRDEVLGDDLATLSGKVVTFSLYIRRLEGSATCQIRIYDNVSGYTNSGHAVDTNFKRIEMSKTLGSSPTRIFVMLDNTGGGTYEFYSPQLEQKSYATEFVNGSRSGRVIDNSGNGNDGILTEATTPKWVNDCKIGKGCYSFNGSSTSIDITGINVVGDRTISFWIKPREITTNWRSVIDSQTGRFIIGTLNGNFSVYNNNNWYLSAPATLSVWQHICVTSEGTTLKIYKNGSYINTYSATILPIGGTTKIGSRFPSETAFLDADLDDFRIYATALSDSDVLQLYQNRHTLDYNGNFFTPRLNETGHKKLTMDYTIWQDGQTGSVGSFGQNSSNNRRVLGIDPWGKQTVVWEAYSISGTTNGGGISYSPIAVDNTKTYRFVFWENRITNADGTYGRYYFGCNAYGSVNGVANLSGTVNTNPYFWSVAHTSLTEGEWFMIVGHIHPHTYSLTTSHPDSGIYTLKNGKISGISSDFKWLPETATGRSRTLSLYQPTATQTMLHHTVYPRMDICDGTEPSITELLAGYDSNNIDYIRTIGGGRNLSLDAGSSLSNVGRFSEIGITNGLIAYYPLDGNANDYSGYNKNLTTVTATYSGDGVIKGCYTFISTNVINGYGYDFPATTTISGWGYATGFGANMLFSFNSASYSGVDLYYNSSSIFWNTGDGVANPFKNSGVNVASPSLNTWHHYVVTNDPVSNKAILYLDGSYYGEAVYRSTEQTGRGFTIGNYYYGNNGYAWLGSIDEIRVYNRILSVEEIGILYEMGVTDKKMKLSKDTVYIKGELKEGY